MSEMLGFSAHFHVHETNLGGRCDDDEWSRDSTEACWSFDRLERTDKYPDLTISKDEFEKSDQFWYVYVIYSTGDSFGHDARSSKLDVGLYSDYELAHKVAAAIRAHTNMYRNRDQRPKNFNEFSLKLPDGQTICASWNGYFESLDYIEVEKVDLKHSTHPKRY